MSIARGYFALQAAGGALWWIAVFASSDVRFWTLGQWDPLLLVGPDLVLFAGASAFAAVTGSRIAAVVAAVWTTAVSLALAGYGLVQQAAGWGVVLMSLATVGSVAAAATIWFGQMPTSWFFVGPFEFRVAENGRPARHLRRSLMQLVVFWTTFFVLVPFALAFVENRLNLVWNGLDSWGVRFAGATAFVLGSVIGLWACITMALRGNGTPLPADTARDLVTTGPYRLVRNPMATAGVLQTAGVGLLIGSWMVIGVACAGAVAWNVLIRPVEEGDLDRRFGRSYRRYTQQVRCWIPVPRHP